MTALLPLVLLASLEVGLRVVAGPPTPLFVPVPDAPGWLAANPQVSRRYFGPPGRAGAPAAVIEPIPFAAEKPAGGLRLVVQGGSSAAGFPYGRWGGLAGMLGDRLVTTLPDRPVEVITTAMAAVNSYAVLDQVEEILAVSPDAVLIYAGHNEYLGVLGVGSALGGARSRAATLAHLRLTRLRIYQALEDGIGMLRRAFARDDAPPSTLFARAAAGAHIPFGSARYREGVDQLEANLGEALRRYAAAGVPVYVGTLVSNEKDQPPFVSGRSARVDPAAWERAWQTLDAQRRAGHDDAARATARALLEMDPRHASAWYALARLEHDAGRNAAAREAYRRARDCDELRFRAPDAFEGVIRAQAQRHGARVVEVEAAFATATPDGIPGRELLLEHVHPNARGYFLLADAYHAALARDGLLGDVGATADRESAARDLPITAIDERLAAWAVLELTAAPPFTAAPQPVVLPEPKDEIDQLARRLRAGESDWLQTMEALLQHYRRQGATREAARVARLVAQAYPFDRAPSHAAGMLYLRLGEPARARHYLRQARRARPDDVETLRALARANALLEDAELAGDGR